MLSIGIVGLPNVGKSTLFNAMLKRQASLAANYPFATIEPNVGIVDVVDYRLNRLAEIVKPKQIIPAVVKFYDIAGLVKGASVGEGLGNQFLSHIREVDAIVHLVRFFDDENIIRAGSVSPKDDIEIINTELVLADLASVEKRTKHGERDLKTRSFAETSAIEKLYRTLSGGELAINAGLNEDELATVKDLNLLTLKPILYVYNVSEKDLSVDLVEKAANLPEGIPLCASLEFEITQMPKEDTAKFMEAYGMKASGLDKLINKGYETLGLQTFLTAGTKEVRAWTIKKGSKAPEAAGVIHTDFERGFISAEVVSFKDYAENNGIKRCKEKGLVRMEGKEYVMRDRDVVEFNFSV